MTPALQPELKDQAAYYATLVNTGILTPNEAREALRLETIDGFDQPRVPANIAGSAANPEQGGRPEETPPAEEENMTKNMMLKALSEYMQAKNVDTISLTDYKADQKAPVRDFLLRRKVWVME